MEDGEGAGDGGTEEEGQRVDEGGGYSKGLVVSLTFLSTDLRHFFLPVVVDYIPYAIIKILSMDPPMLLFPPSATLSFTPASQGYRSLFLFAKPGPLAL